MKEKCNYEKPRLNVLPFNGEDILTNSGGGFLEVGGEYQWGEDE